MRKRNSPFCQVSAIRTFYRMFHQDAETPTGSTFTITETTFPRV